MSRLFSSLTPRSLIIPTGVALIVFLFGLYQVYTATRRYDDLAAIPIQSLVDTAQNNQTSADSLALIEKNKDDAATARNQAYIVVGVGAVLIGIVAFIYSRLPDQPTKKA